MEINDELFKSVLDNLHHGVCCVDKDRKIVYWNKYSEILTGFKSEEMTGRQFELCKGSLCPVQGALEDGTKQSTNVYLNKKDGNRLPALVKASPFLKEGKITGAIVTINDNSSRVALARKIKELEKMSSVDFLTRLHNRRLIEKEIYGRLEELQRYNRQFGVVFIDIDHFKKINDSYGHEVGDMVLKLISKRLLDSLRPFDFLGRWGGEEFIMSRNLTENHTFQGVVVP